MGLLRKALERSGASLECSDTFLETFGSLWHVSGKLWKDLGRPWKLPEGAVRYLGEALEGFRTSPEHSGTPWEIYKQLCPLSRKLYKAVGRLQKALGRLRTALEDPGMFLKGSRKLWDVFGRMGHLLEGVSPEDQGPPRIHARVQRLHTEGD